MNGLSKPSRGTTNAAAVHTAAPLAAAPEVDVRRYSVLYYKRSKKVHKSRGVSRLDGILTVAAAPSCLVTLTDADGGADTSSEEDDSSDDDDDCGGGGKYGSSAKRGGGGKGRNENKKKQQAAAAAKKKNKSASVSSGINWSIAKKAFGIEQEGSDEQRGGAKAIAAAGTRNEFRLGPNGLHGGDIVALSQWECEVTGVLSSSSSGGIGSAAAAAAAVGGKSLVVRNDALSGRAKPGALLSRKAANQKPLLVGRKRPLVPLRSGGGGMGAAATSSSAGPGGRIQKSSTLPKRVPPMQPGALARVGRGSSSSVAAASGGDGSSSNGSSILAGRKPPAPASVRSKLRPHQRLGVTFLWHCLTGSSPSLNRAAEESGAGHTAARGAILADEMGLGKTLMTISAIFALHRRDREKRFVVVCPSSLVTNWSKEFDKWIGRASQPKRVVIKKGGEDGQRAIKAFVPVKPNKAEVLIVSYELFRMNVGMLSQAAQIGLLVVDEGHRLKNTAGSQTLSALNSLRCDARLLITGTPIQNTLSEFYNVVNFVCPGILSDLSTFRKKYERPIAASNNRAATAEQRSTGRSLSRTLDAITSTFMLRRLQRDVLRDHLPPRTEVLLFCRPSERQRDKYKTLTAGVSGRVSPTLAGGSADSLTLLTKLRKLCSHPYLLSETSKTAQDSDNEDVSLSGKLSILESLLSSVRTEAPTDKVVVISNFTSALTVIEDAVLRRRGWSSIRLDGTTEQNVRQSLVDSFNRGTAEQSFVFLLSSKAGGCGLNLIGANRLVMFDPDWNPATDMQAMARIYRQGQTKPCFIYRMFTSGTVEEVIYQRQTQKSNLATLTVDGQINSKKSGTKKQSTGFSKDELRDCFTLKEHCACDTKRKVGKKWDEYSGVSSLQSQGCTDGPLLSIANDRQDVLSFIQIVPDEPAASSGEPDEKPIKKPNLIQRHHPMKRSLRGSTSS